MPVKPHTTTASSARLDIDVRILISLEAIDSVAFEVVYARSAQDLEQQRAAGLERRIEHAGKPPRRKHGAQQPVHPGQKLFLDERRADEVRYPVSK